MLGRKSLDTILSSFNKTLVDLQTLQDENSLESGKNQAKIENLRSKNEALLRESLAAGRVEKKLSELLA